MHEGIYFADAELPFHVWVRERTGPAGYRWVLRDKSAVEGPADAPESPDAPRDAAGQAADADA